MKKTYYFPQFVIEQMHGNNNQILISLINANDPPTQTKGNWLDILRLEFDDIDVDTPGCILFNKEHARKIINYLSLYEELDELTIMVHCTAGISRSAAVAKFVADYFDIEDFNHKYSLYNKHVYRTLINEWKGYTILYPREEIE